MNFFKKQTKVIDMQGNTPKFQIGQTVYMVSDARVGRGVIEEITYHVKQDGIKQGYVIKDITGREAEWPEAMLLTDLEEAKKSALINIENGINKARIIINSLSDARFDEVVNEANKKKEAKKNG
jgi:hypothetical protein